MDNKIDTLEDLKRAEKINIFLRWLIVLLVIGGTIGVLLILFFFNGNM